MDQLVEHNLLPARARRPNAKTNYVVELIPADRGWILEKLANEIHEAAAASELGISTCVLDEPTGNADLTYFLPYSKQRKVRGSVVGSWFTHQEQVEPAKSRFIEKAKEADFCLCPAKRYQKLLRRRGVKEVDVIYHGVDLETYEPKLKIGVVGRTYHTGRKGEHLLAPAMGLKNVEFMFTGLGWPVASAEQDLAEFYQSIDYLLIPATIEGGPVPLFEALAAGCNVIASDVGCVEDFPHIPFQKGNRADLKRVIEKLRDDKFELRKSVDGLTWRRFGQSHVDCFIEQIEKRKPANRSKRLRAAARTTKSPLPRVAIISHGTEKTSKGGPTTRIAAIHSTFAERGGQSMVAATFDEAAAQLSEMPQAAHIFNSWPLKSALTEIAAARRSGVPVVYSPIALNLSARAFFEGVVPDILKHSSSAAQLTRLVGQVCARTAEWSANTAPLQGADEHFDHLARGVAQSDCVVFLSEYERALLASLNIVPKRSQLIRNGVETDIFATANPKLFTDRYGLSDFLLIVGRIEGRKNQALAAFALRELNMPLVCIGHAGNNDYLEQIKRWGGANFIHIDRTSDRHMLASAYKAARALILTSWAEGAPLVALEAGAAGTPLFLSTMSSEREHFGELAKYFHPADLEGLRLAIEEELKSSETPQQRQERSDFCVSRYDIKQHVADTIALYEEITPSKISSLPRARIPDTIDVTHLAHSLHNGMHHTGVTALESSILEQMLALAPNTKCVLWNSPLRAYVQVPAHMMRAQTFPSLANSRQVPEDVVPSVARARYDPQQLGGDGLIGRAPVRAPEIGKMSNGQIFRTLLKYGVFSLRGNPQNLAIKAVKVFWPTFKLEIPPQHDFLRRIHWKTDPEPVSNPAMPATQDGGDQLPTVIYDSVPTRFPLITGDRLFLFGQPWISNERQLSDLVSFVQINDLSLHVLIHDILYVTDVNSFPNKARQDYRRRLISLLRVAHTLLATSHAVVGSVQNLIKSEKLDCKVKLIRVGIPKS
ncbi:MAG: glycosyltransferase, partial [Rhizobiales bacterium]|nr:glycosyltransferase [Hyphomicrobiales bacterium]